VDNISIADISGRTVKTINQVSKELKLNDLKAGVYVINHLQNGTSTSDKIVKK
jgi:predicted methyltransferase